jgi:4'-phosphopantetheinyl transferase
MSATWQRPEKPPVLATDEVHVWLAHLPAALSQLEKLRGTLCPDELERAARFRTEPLRERWVLTRGLLRARLADYLAQDAREICFATGPLGKPSLPGHPGFFFNTSHSGDDAAFAFTRVGEVGVDIEQLRAGGPRHEAIARRFFTPAEQAELAAVPEPERTRAFLGLWTRKEAFVKARGDGVFSGLETFEVSLHGNRIQFPGNGDATIWWLRPFPENVKTVGAVVVKSDDVKARFFI